jgi:ABC-2 type transport system ATP-binding protein
MDEAGARRARLNRGMRTTASLPENVVETDGLTKRFGERAVVNGVELRVPRGVAFGYLGPNGAGKTTLIRMLLGLTPATSGEMRLLGLPVPAKREQALARVGAIVEEPCFHGHLTGRENLEIAAAARSADTAARIDASLERVGLSARAGDRVKTHSLGMRQRLGIARCLIAEPELLVLDEPMNGLDPAGIQDFRRFVRDFVAQGGTIVLSSHLLDEVEKTCDAIAIVDNGRIAVQGTIGELRGIDGEELMLGVDDPDRARTLLAAERSVRSVSDNGHELRVSLDDPSAAADLNRRLVEAGIAVHRLEPSQATLERRFLEITSRLENNS